MGYMFASPSIYQCFVLAGYHWRTGYCFLLCISYLNFIHALFTLNYITRGSVRNRYRKRDRRRRDRSRDRHGDRSQRDRSRDRSDDAGDGGRYGDRYNDNYNDNNTSSGYQDEVCVVVIRVRSVFLAFGGGFVSTVS